MIVKVSKHLVLAGGSRAQPVTPAGLVFTLLHVLLTALLNSGPLKPSLCFWVYYEQSWAERIQFSLSVWSSNHMYPYMKNTLVITKQMNSFFCIFQASLCRPICPTSKTSWSWMSSAVWNQSHILNLSFELIMNITFKPRCNNHQTHQWNIVRFSFSLHSTHFSLNCALF